jgi:hypothetical protein
MKSKLPPLSRSLVRGFIGGLLVMAIAAAGLALALTQIFASAPDPLTTWPAVLRADDAQSLGVESASYQITTTRTAGDLAAAYADNWAALGWDVTTHVETAQAQITATRGLARYVLLIQAQAGVVKLSGDGWQGGTRP